MEKPPRKETATIATSSTFVSAHGLQVSAVSELAGLDGLREEWSRLLAVSASDSIFLSPDWSISWWEAYGAGKQLEILLFHRAGALVGIAPLYRVSSRWLGILSLWRLHLIGDGSGDSDYLDFIAARGEEEALASSVFDYLKKEGAPWHVLALSEVPSDSPLLAAMKAAAGRRGLLLVERHVPCTYAELPSSWDSYLASLKPRMRTKVRSLLKKLASDPRLEFRVLDDPALIEGWLEHLYHFHEARWRLEGQAGVFGLPGKRDFYRRLTTRLFASGLLRFYGLFRDGVPIALQYCFAWRDRILLLQEGFDPSYAEEGIGNMLRARVFQDSVAKRVVVYDFLAGVTQHKLVWGGAVKHTSRLLIANRRLRAAVHVYLPVAGDSLKDVLKRAIPPSLREKLQRLRATSKVRSRV